MKNIKYLIVIVVLLILNGVLAYKYKLHIKTFNSTVSIVNETLGENKKKLLTFKQNFVNERVSENLKLADSITLLDIEGKKIFSERPI